MKKTIKNLSELIKKEGKDLNVTGQTAMELLNITSDDLRYVCDEFRAEIYDCMFITASVKYAKKIRENFDLNDEVYWYLKDQNDPKYITISMNRIYHSCEEFHTMIYKKGKFELYSISIKEMITKLKEISEDEPITLSLDFLYDSRYVITIKNKEVINVVKDFDSFELENELYQKFLINQILILSYDTPIIETLKLLELEELLK